ncbi:SseB family protein [Microbacterium halotolerans]|uniref:SseB family protein n=1 Tax=Microbacterium halotolerans TaxID=246613 RepID=UPI000E6AC37A|nr:SseB family protein [Microbacterium halotolerans]
MGLFSRKKKNDRDPKGDEVGELPEPDQRSVTEPESAPGGEVVEPDQDADRADADAGASADDAPSVNISMTSFQGLGSTGGEAAPAQEREPAPTEQPAVRPPLPGAPAAPPTQLETVPGLRDNALVRDALAALPEKPTGAQVMGVIRQMLQGHLYLRVQGDARKTLSEGGQVTFGVAKAGDKDYMMVFSSGAALRDAVKADGDTQTSAVAQPTPALVRHLLSGTFAGIIVDNYSKQRRAVLPRDVVEKAFDQADSELRLKSLLAQPRDADTPGKISEVLAQKPPVWVAVGEVNNDAEEGEQKKYGIAEARLADGTRLLQVFSHPLEVVALGRPEKAMPLAVDKIAKMLKDHPQLGGLLIDPAGPLMTLTRDELAPVIAIAE